MPVEINGFYISRSPRDETVISYPVTINNPLAVTTRTSFPNQFRGFARSVLFINQDGVNAATIRINGITNSTINLPASASFSINDQWIADIEVLAGAAGAVIVLAEIVPLEIVN